MESISASTSASISASISASNIEQNNEQNNEQNIEKYLNDNPIKLSLMNNYLRLYQFSEDFLIKNRIYYDSWKCLRTQNNLSPYFCFRYLYDTQEYDSADNWTDYNDVMKYLKNKNYTTNHINDAYNKAINDKNQNDK